MNGYATSENINQKVEEWLDEISAFNLHKMKLDVSKAALLVTDMQRHFLHEGSPVYTEGGPAIVNNIRRLIDAFREVGRPVIYTRHVHSSNGYDAGLIGEWWSDMIVDGTPESEIIDELKPMDGDPVVKKHRYSAFYNTDLETILRCTGVKDLVITGVMTNLCCETTARDAFLRDFHVFFPADCNGAATEEMHIATLMNLAWGFAYICTAEELLKGM
jgi:nicotinamidase-related amidase